MAPAPARETIVVTVPGFIRAVALDLDGTIAHHDAVSAAVLDEIDRRRDAGLAVLLVTGRIIAELEAAFPGLTGHFDAVVSENGGVLSSEESIRLLGPPVDDALADALTRKGISLRRGHVLLAGEAPDAEAVAATVADLGLDHQLMRNRHAIMLLPAGVSKGTGLLAALAELGISEHNTLAVGDAENDLSLLGAAEVGIAVGNAVPSLRVHADRVLAEPDGRGVAELLRGPVLSGHEVIRPDRRRTTVGRHDDGTPATVPAWPSNILVCGQSGAGKSYIAGLLVEEWVVAGYTVLVIDMEGDHIALDRLRRTVVVEAPAEPEELLSILRQHSLSVVLDVSGLELAHRLEYLRGLPPLVEAERAAWGLPHWVVVDEAHETLGENGLATNVFRPADGGYCLVTYHPEKLAPEATAGLDVTITAQSVGHGAAGSMTATGTIREAGGAERPFAVGTRRTRHVRHRHKYEMTRLPEQRWFHFRRPNNRVVAEAGDIRDFARVLRTVDPAVIDHHLRHGDFSRWILGALQDKELATAVGAIERGVIARHAGDVLRAREQIDDEVRLRYLLEEYEAGGETTAGAGGAERCGDLRLRADPASVSRPDGAPARRP